MNFGLNLQILRKKNHLSQEELAEKLAISRQAISKWESGTGFPEMEKLIQISELFGYPVDTLLKGEITEDEDLKYVTTKEYQKFGKGITIGIMLLILGCSFVCFFSELEEIQAILFLLFGTFALAFFVYFGITHDHFIKTHNVENIYNQSDIDTYQKKFVLGIVIGVVLILLDTVGLLILESIFPTSPETIKVGVFLCFLVLTVPFLIYNGIQKSKFTISNPKLKEKVVLVRKIQGVIFLLTIFIYLSLGFAKDIWLWYIFILGFILCGIASIVFKK